jgi:hypothetical protein
LYFIGLVEMLAIVFNFSLFYRLSHLVASLVIVGVLFLLSVSEVCAQPFLRYRGTQVAGTTMTNFRLNSAEAVSPQRANYISWRAPRTGRIVEMWAWFKTDNQRGYSSGNRGTYKISVRPNVGRLPGLKVIGGKRRLHSFVNNNTRDNFRRITLRRGVKVVGGKSYHFMFINTAFKPHSNWLSLNAVAVANGDRRIASPTCSDVLCFGFKDSLGRYLSGIPVVVFGLDVNGDRIADIWAGNPYVGVFSRYGSYNPWSRPIAGSSMTRIKYPVAKKDSHTIFKVGVAAYRLKGLGPLIVLLKDKSGQCLARAIIPNKSFPATPNPSGISVMKWGEADFDTPVKVLGGKEYYLELSTNPGTIYHPVALQDSAETYDGPNLIDGRYGGWFGLNAYAQHSLNGGKTWQNYSLVNSKHPSYTTPSLKWDLSFYVLTR